MDTSPLPQPSEIRAREVLLRLLPGISAYFRVFPLSADSRFSSQDTHPRSVHIVVCRWQNVWFSQLPLLRPGRQMPAWTMARFTVNLSGPYLKRQAFSRSLCRFSGRLISQGANYMTESGPHDLRLPLIAFLNHCAILVVATSSAQILQYTFVLICASGCSSALRRAWAVERV